MTLLFNSILKTGKVPQEFKDALIVILYKKGSMLDCDNYRPISLLSHLQTVHNSDCRLRMTYMTPLLPLLNLTSQSTLPS